MAAALIEEEEREEAQRKVRGVELAPVRGVSDAMSLVHEWVASSEVPAAAFLWWRLSAQCVVCSGGGRSRRASCRRARARAERVEGRPAKRRRGAAAARRARRVGKPAAPARYPQQALAIAARWRMQRSPRFLPRRSRVVRSSLPAASRRRRSGATA
jgi:hypothetical protein